VRGLKYNLSSHVTQVTLSHPAWGAWIEIHGFRSVRTKFYVAPRMGCVD